MSIRVATTSTLLIAHLLSLSRCAAEETRGRRVEADGVAAGDVVQVTLRGGRALCGQVDPATDERSLWLVGQRPGIVLRSRVDWQDVARIDRADSAAMRPLSAPPLTFTPPFTPMAAAPNVGPPGLPPIPDPAFRFVPLDVPMIAEPRPRSRVRSVELRAVPANWNDDAETDGLRVLVLPLGDKGEIVPVHADLTFALTALPIRFIRDDKPPPVIERWNRTVVPGDFGPHGAVVELPWRHLPRFDDAKFAPFGRLTLRLGVSGLGTFDARDENVPLTTPSMFRRAAQFHETALPP